MKIKQWIGDVRERFVPAEGEYVHASEVPDEPEGPYRARLERGSAQTMDGVEVGEREKRMPTFRTDDLWLVDSELDVVVDVAFGRWGRKCRHLAAYHR